MSNTLKLKKPVVPTYRVYIAEEPGALLVRHGQSQDLRRALRLVAKFAEAVDWQIRMLWNGKETLVQVEHHVL